MEFTKYFHKNAPEHNPSIHRKTKAKILKMKIEALNG